MLHCFSNTFTLSCLVSLKILISSDMCCSLSSYKAWQLSIRSSSSFNLKSFFAEFIISSLAAFCWDFNSYLWKTIELWRNKASRAASIAPFWFNTSVSKSLRRSNYYYLAKSLSSTEVSPSSSRTDSPAVERIWDLSWEKLWDIFS